MAPVPRRLPASIVASVLALACEASDGGAPGAEGGAPGGVASGATPGSRAGSDGQPGAARDGASLGAGGALGLPGGMGVAPSPGGAGGAVPPIGAGGGAGAGGSGLGGAADAGARGSDGPLLLPADGVGRDGGLASQIATGGLPGPREACYGLPGENRLTPGTMIRYCQGAHADCKQPGARCPLYVTVQGSGAYFGRLKDPAKYGKFITAEVRSTGDNDAGTLEAIAQVPRLIARDFPGLDEDRVYIVGQSGGSYFVRRALCLGPAADRALAGSISDVYAAWASLIMCPKCDRPFVPKAGNFHVLNIIGEVDGTTAGQCGAELRMMAQGLGCATPHGGTCNVPAGDPLHPRADGGPAARKMLFGACSKGSLAAYVMTGEAHTVKFAKAYSPAVDAYEIAWQWFQDKRKSGGGAAVGTACPM